MPNERPCKQTKTVNVDDCGDIESPAEENGFEKVYCLLGCPFGVPNDPKAPVVEFTTVNI